MVSVETLKERSLKNIGKVEPFVKDLALEIIDQCYEEGILIQFSSGFRSFNEQNRLYAKGRTTAGKIVTNAKGGQSIHNYGLALDYFLVSDDGQKALWTVNEKWKRVAEIAKEKGFSWGGDWTSFKDYPHIEYTKGLTWRELKEGKRPKPPKVEKVTIDGTCKIEFEEKEIEGVIINGVSYAPVREVAELNELKVGWNSQTKTVQLTK